jgi:uncharacterized RDD family membrane protein YckC
MDQTEQRTLVPADKGERIVNLLIDTIVIYAIIFGVAMIITFVPGIFPEDGSPFGIVLFFGMFIFFYTLFEYFLGKTPGKILTNTHVVTVDGGKPGFLQLCWRSICRFIPFDAITFLMGVRGWHDEFSKTSVVKDKVK